MEDSNEGFTISSNFQNLTISDDIYTLIIYQ